MLPDLAEIEHLKVKGGPGWFCHVSNFFDVFQTQAWLGRSKQEPGFMDGLRRLAAETQSAEKSAFGLTDDLVLAEVAAALRAGALVYEETFPKKTDKKGKGRDTGTASGAGGGGGGDAGAGSQTSQPGKSSKKPRRDSKRQTTPGRSSTDAPPPPPAPVGNLQFDPAPAPPPFDPPAQPPAMPGREASGQTH
jgi:hypothetical protein